MYYDEAITKKIVPLLHVYDVTYYIISDVMK